MVFKTWRNSRDNFSEENGRSHKSLLVKKNSETILENTEKNVQYSQGKSKSSEKRSSRSWKGFASQVAISEKLKKTSGSIKQKNQFGHEGEGRSHSKERGATAGHEGNSNLGNSSLHQHLLHLNVLFEFLDSSKFETEDFVDFHHPTV